MLEKSVNAGVLLVSGIAFIILGVCLFFINQLTLKILLVLFGGITILFGIYSIFKAIIEKSPILPSILAAIRDLGIGLIILLFPNLILQSFAVCFGIYLFIHTLINIISYLIYQKNQIKGRFKLMLTIMLQIFFFIPLLFHSKQNVFVTSIILGCYLIGYGITNITDVLTIVLPKRTTDKIKKQIQIPLPVILNAFIPRKLITLVNEMLEVEPNDDFDSKKQMNIPDIFVLIHLAPNGTAAMGHVEIAFEDKIYSYGNYDMHSRSLFDAVGDGIVLVADKKSYIEYLIKKKERYVIEFGLSLTKKEIEVVKCQLDKLVHTNTEIYFPDLQLAEKGLLPAGNYHDMSSEIYKYASGKFYKIIKGKYKKFFVLKTNCAMVAQYVLSSIGKQILCINGIITPGAYYDYLNARFKLKNTNVISRKVYTKKDFQYKKKKKKSL